MTGTSSVVCHILCAQVIWNLVLRYGIRFFFFYFSCRSALSSCFQEADRLLIVKAIKHSQRNPLSGDNRRNDGATRIDKILNQQKYWKRMKWQRDTNVLPSVILTMPVLLETKVDRYPVLYIDFKKTKRAN